MACWRWNSNAWSRSWRSGWYEWQKHAEGKQPFVFHLADDALFAFAGIWTRGPEESGAAEDTYAIITTDANPVAAPVHNRMPAILNENACKIWMDTENKDSAPPEKLLAPYQGKDLDTYPVSTYVNSPKNTGEACLQRTIA